MTTIEPLRIQIFNGSFTTLLVLIVKQTHVARYLQQKAWALYFNVEWY